MRFEKINLLNSTTKILQKFIKFQIDNINYFFVSVVFIIMPDSTSTSTGTTSSETTTEKTREEFDTCKVILLGDISCGKTSLVKRFLYDRFDADPSPTLGLCYNIVKFPNKLSMQIWDTSGTERYQNMIPAFYRRSNVAIICYDMSDLYAWTTIKFWTRELSAKSPSIKMYFVGCKGDLRSDLPIDLALEEARLPLNQELFVTSSKNGSNCRPLFERIMTDFEKDRQILLREYRREEPYRSIFLFQEESNDNQDKPEFMNRCCCI